MEVQRKLASLDVILWLRENYKIGRSGSVSKNSVFQHYLSACRDKGIEPLISATYFGKLVKKAFPHQIKYNRKGPRGAAVQHYTHLKRIKHPQSMPVSYQGTPVPSAHPTIEDACCVPVGVSSVEEPRPYPLHSYIGVKQEVRRDEIPGHLPPSLDMIPHGQLLRQSSSLAEASAPMGMPGARYGHALSHPYGTEPADAYYHQHHPTYVLHPQSRSAACPAPQCLASHSHHIDGPLHSTHGLPDQSSAASPVLASTRPDGWSSRTVPPLPRDYHYYQQQHLFHSPSFLPYEASIPVSSISTASSQAQSPHFQGSPRPAHKVPPGSSSPDSSYDDLAARYHQAPFSSTTLEPAAGASHFTRHKLAGRHIMTTPPPAEPLPYQSHPRGRSHIGLPLNPPSPPPSLLLPSLEPSSYVGGMPRAIGAVPSRESGLPSDKEQLAIRREELHHAYY